MLWSSFALSTRGIGGSSLTVADAAFLRFATPVVLLAPLLPSTIRAVRRERPYVLALLLVGGLPHFLVFAFGAQLTSAALTGMLVPGTVPLFVTLLAGTAELDDVLLLTALQGIGTGLMSTLCYAFSVRALGSGRASVGGAVSPVLTAVVAVPIFGERIGVGLAVALALIVAGVATFNRVGSAPSSGDDPAGLEPDDVVGGGDALLVMGDARDRGAAGGLLGEELAGALPAGGVEPCGGFVQEQDLRTLDDALSQ